MILSWPVMVFLMSPFVGDYMHFLLLYPSYRAQIEAEPDSDSRPISFYWGPSGMVSAETEKWLVYDTTGHPTEVARKFSSFAEVSARRLMGNFFLVQASW